MKKLRSSIRHSYHMDLGDPPAVRWTPSCWKPDHRNSSVSMHHRVEVILGNSRLPITTTIPGIEMQTDLNLTALHKLCLGYGTWGESRSRESRSLDVAHSSENGWEHPIRGRGELYLAPSRLVCSGRQSRGVGCRAMPSAPPRNRPTSHRG